MWSTKLTVFVSSISVTIYLLVLLLAISATDVTSGTKNFIIDFVWIKHQKKRPRYVYGEKDNETTNWNKCEYYKSVRNVVVPLTTTRPVTSYIYIIIGTHTEYMDIEKEDRKRKTFFYIHFIYFSLIFFCFGHHRRLYSNMFLII